ncbi:MAG: tetratricopeptide repeat protein [Candidatus Omnitrophota bacterium]
MPVKTKPALIGPVILIIALTAVIYCGALMNSFVGDDIAVIVNNDFIKDWKNLPLVFSSAYLTDVRDLGFLGTRSVGAGEITYRPLATLSYFVDYHLWKLKAFGFHLTNLLLHIINALLIFALANILTGSHAVSLSAALLFALHPVNSEAVNAICFREDLLAFLFFVSSLIFYIIRERSAGIRKTCAYGLSLAAFFLALFSKEMAVTLPLVIILYDYYFAKKRGLTAALARLKSGYAGYFIILAFYLWIWGVVFKNPNPPAAYQANSLYAHILTMSTVIAGYIQWIAAPVQLYFAVTEPHLIVRHFNPEVFSSLLLIAAWIAAAIIIRKLAKEMSFSIAWFFVTLLPVSGIVPMQHIVGLRYLYIPIAGLCLFLALALKKTAGKLFRVILVVILTVYALLSMERTAVWSDNISLWSEIAARYPDNYYAHYGLGEVFLKSGMQNRAGREFKTALRLNPKDAVLHYRLAYLYTAAGRYSEAEKAYKEAIALDPGYLEACNDLAALYSETNRLNEAIALWEKAVEIDPLFMTGHFNLAVFYFQNKQYGRAIKHADAVVNAGGKIDPAFMELLKPHRKTGQ